MVKGKKLKKVESIYYVRLHRGKSTLFIVKSGETVFYQYNCITHQIFHQRVQLSQTSHQVHMWKYFDPIDPFIRYIITAQFLQKD